ncbi:hypothetical protein FJTKL_03991 [Diaporthe vaccinii]|uniref:Uncharacterized protein n=1 Tax=Diaporthe vaccinii TaxID=105482 RepID=A0ABR4DUT1_9PEZI
MLVKKTPSDLQHALVLNIDIALITHRVGSDLLVIALKSSKIFPGLREFTFLHTLTNIPVDERALGVHEIELGGQSGPGLGNGGCVGEHAPKRCC